MAEKLMRVYKKMDVHEVKSHLLIYGDLGGSCANCQKMDIKLDVTHCTECKTEIGQEELDYWRKRLEGKIKVPIKKLMWKF